MATEKQSNAKIVKKKEDQEKGQSKSKDIWRCNINQFEEDEDKMHRSD